ncbi:hypothetical protein FA950_30345 [Bacillus thuringiensis]|uniref:hypothetical protein n=1 Tax=Bacillus thuringiensis TaxID=1428 RepID=UPI0010AC3CBF|nr:hypothetical protein [Bacillus thuringiensis]TJZ99586.1 hypothetical protein FA950_30345 [Bacillus thuringiensis]
MKKKILGMMTCGALAVGMMTIGSTSASAEPLKITSTSPFGTEAEAETNPKFWSDVTNGMKDIATAVISTGSKVTDAVGKVAGDQWTGMVAQKAWEALSAVNMACDGWASLGKTSDTTNKNGHASELEFDNK